MLKKILLSAGLLTASSFVNATGSVVLWEYELGLMNSHPSLFGLKDSAGNWYLDNSGKKIEYVGKKWNVFDGAGKYQNKVYWGWSGPETYTVDGGGDANHRYVTYGYWKDNLDNETSGGAYDQAVNDGNIATKAEERWSLDAVKNFDHRWTGMYENDYYDDNAKDNRNLQHRLGFAHATHKKDAFVNDDTVDTHLKAKVARFTRHNDSNCQDRGVAWPTLFFSESASWPGSELNPTAMSSVYVYSKEQNKCMNKHANGSYIRNNKGEIVSPGYIYITAEENGRVSDWGIPGTPIRNNKCDAEFPIGSSKYSEHKNKAVTANKICKLAPNVMTVHQRYTMYNYIESTNGNGWNVGCENITYVWGYDKASEHNNAHQNFFRAGELRWTIWQSTTSNSYIEPTAPVWDTLCNKNNGTNVIYSGIYKLNESIEEDDYYQE
ncbi:hypothetical protein [Aliikangiella sp. G2MR2-5]|uniref:hypothetical protein n=1 Tax=Aliikangiella sp. G2MR2-5 TaxID=2788943 RepID=UPI0018A9AE55|nr:hypothetical protein [Aliikangiella sp. G2MR2-5]